MHKYYWYVCLYESRGLVKTIGVEAQHNTHTAQTHSTSNFLQDFDLAMILEHTRIHSQPSAFDLNL